MPTTETASPTYTSLQVALGGRQSPGSALSESRRFYFHMNQITVIFRKDRTGWKEPFALFPVKTRAKILTAN